MTYPKPTPEHPSDCRDPRVDPRPGDVLRGGTTIITQRTVTDEPRGTGQFLHYRIKGRGNKKWLETLGNWRKWAAGATVVKRGDDNA